MKPEFHQQKWWRLGRLPVLGLLFAVTVILAGSVSAGVPNEDCAACHDGIGEAFTRTPHGVYLGHTADAEYSCESCHGPGDAHAEEGNPELIINPANHDSFAGKETCLECHRGAPCDDWEISGHRNADVTCGDCHQMHGEAGQTLKKKSPELCYDCHSDVRAASYMPSHHPIAEGKIACLDCHNVHGGPAAMTLTDGGRELCFSCHAEKEGPFLFEHAPVNEDCMLCHTPHGAVADNLLKQSEPALCLNCHAMHFHATVEGVDGKFVPQQAPDRVGYSTRDAWKSGMLTKCTQCHTEIHGSDLPSQSISGQGTALTR